MHVVCPQTVGKRSLVGEGGSVVPLLLRLLRPLGALTGDAAHKAFPKTVNFGGRSPPPMCQGHGVPDHQVLHIGGAWHVPAVDFFSEPGGGGVASCTSASTPALPLRWTWISSMFSPAPRPPLSALQSCRSSLRVTWQCNVLSAPSSSPPAVYHVLELGRTLNFVQNRHFLETGPLEVQKQSKLRHRESSVEKSAPQGCSSCHPTKHGCSRRLIIVRGGPSICHRCPGSA